MTLIALTGGYYQARSPASSAQSCLNLYPETAPPGEDDPPMAHYLTPGLIQLYQDPTNQAEVRGLFDPGFGDGNVYAVIGSQVYVYNVLTRVGSSIGSISSASGPVNMESNGLVIVIVDGTPNNGWYIALSTQTLTQIVDSAFLGGQSVVVLDTYLLFNAPGTAQWFASPSNYAGNSTPFDPLYIASKSTYPDNLNGLACVNQVVWLIGVQTTELWIDAGNTDFPFQRVPEVLIQHGTPAPYSIATADGGVFWLSNDVQGHGIILHGTGYQVARISTPAIEYELATLNSTLNLTYANCVGMTYQKNGHTFYELSSPTLNKTFVYDLMTGLWHQRSSQQSDGTQGRHRINCCVNSGIILAGDFENGILYQMDDATYTDNGAPIMRQRAFQHITNDSKRAFYRTFTVSMNTMSDTTDLISLDWSNDQGVTYQPPVTLPMTNTDGGSLSWWRLGMARDRVFRLTWSAPIETALMGAWVEVSPGAS